ncbi:MAG: hypothetical protein WD749_04065 [Phycisphaerales bacterium]
MTSGKTCSTRRRLTMAVLCLLMAGFALLFWSRLKLVTGVPRTAYAEPDQRQADPGPRPSPRGR